MWNVKIGDMTLNACPTLDDAMVFAKAYGKFVTITDGATEIVGKFGVDAVEDAVLPSGDSYSWTMRRDETHRSWKKKSV